MTIAAAHAAGFSLQVDAWLGSILGRPAARLSLDERRPLVPTEIHNAIVGLEWLGRRDLGGVDSCFIDAKVPTHEVPLVSQLSDVGLRVVDVNVTLERTTSADALPGALPGARSDALSDAVVVERFVRTSAHAERVSQGILDIAASAFRCSRFHLDPAFDERLADEVKRSWVANCLSGQRGDQVWLARDGERILGFLTSLAVPPSSARPAAAVIDLVAVHPAAQGRGIGRRLTEAFLDQYTSLVATLRVGTQVANTPALRLYQSMGFEVKNSQYVMHGHFQPVERHP